MNFPKRIVIGSDHAGFDYKEAINHKSSDNELKSSEKENKKKPQFLMIGKVFLWF